MGDGAAGSTWCRGLDACLACRERITTSLHGLSCRQFPQDHDPHLPVRAGHFGVGKHDLATTIGETEIGSLN